MTFLSVGLAGGVGAAGRYLLGFWGEKFPLGILLANSLGGFFAGIALSFFGWGTLGLLCFSAEAVRQHDRGHSWWMAIIRAAYHSMAMAGPVLFLASDLSRFYTGQVLGPNGGSVMP